MSEFLDLKTEIGCLKLELLAKSKIIKELEAKVEDYKARATLFSMTEFFKECEKPDFRNELYEKEISNLKAQITEKDEKITKLEAEVVHRGGEFPVLRWSEILSLQAQIAVLRAGLEDFSENGCRYSSHFTQNLHFSATEGTSYLASVDDYVREKARKILSSNGSELLEELEKLRLFRKQHECFGCDKCGTNSCG